MPAYDPEFFSIDPYYDDFDEAKRYLKMLFRPGFALQARELTQLQSIIQNQIERFGNFVLEDGSMVFGGQITEIPTKVALVEGLSGGGGMIARDLVDKIVEVGWDGVTSHAKIVFAMRDPSDDETNDIVVYYQFLSGEEYGDQDEPIIRGFNQGITFEAGISLGAIPFDGDEIPSGMVVFVDEGIRYTNGYFVSHGQQRIGLYEIPESGSNYIYSTPSVSVGFQTQKTIVNAQQDTSLRDPASGFFNFNAPGADRYKIDLIISQRNIEVESDTAAFDPFSRTDFLEFLRVLDGNVIKREKYPNLGELEETFARRTYDESGHYIVDPFELTMIPAKKSVVNGGNTEIVPVPEKLVSKLDSGKAYVFGYEFETIGSSYITHDKARSSDHIKNTNGEVRIGYSIGPFILGKFSNIENSLSGFDISQSPRILFDSKSGFQRASLNEDETGISFFIYSPVDPTRGLSDVEIDFVPGTTLYASLISDYIDNGTSGPFSGSPPGSGLTPDYVSGRVTKVFREFIRSENALSDFAQVFIRPPFTQTGVNLNEVFFSSNQDSFFVAGGASYGAEGATPHSIYLGQNAEEFRLVDITDFTGGSIEDVIGSARIKNIQRLSGDFHQIFFDDIQVNDNKNLRNILRVYPDVPEAQPIFFAAEFPTQIYNTDQASLIYEAPFGEVVSNIKEYKFMMDISITANFNNGTMGEIDLGSNPYELADEGFLQIGPAINASEVFYNLNSLRFVSVYGKDGKIDGEIRIFGDSNNGPSKFEIKGAKFNNIPFNGTATITIGCLFKKPSIVRKKTLEEGQFTIEFTGPNDDGYWSGYFVTGNSYLTDVIEILSITDGFAGYIFDNGQKNQYYDFSSIKIKLDSGATPPASEQATLKYFSHENRRGPFVGGGYTGSQSSYNNFFEDIPNYNNSTGKTIILRNSIDFRPVRVGNLDEFNLDGPFSENSFVFSGYDNSMEYEYFVPRIDKIVLSRDKRFEKIVGVPDEVPVAPADNPNSMTLYTLRFNPYTFDENDVNITQEDNRRFTMKDIGVLEKRIENIEYYSNLNFLEQDAKNTPIFDRDGFEIPKKAILVDQFSGSEASDIENLDFLCSFNKETKELRPPFEIEEIEISDSDISNLPNGLTMNNGIITFDFTEEPHITNKKTNRSRRINSNKIVDFNGSIKASPHCDVWFSLDKAPIVKTNGEGENDSWKLGRTSFKMNTEFFENHWFGRTDNKKKARPKKFLTRKDYRRKLLSTDNIGTFSLPNSNLSSTPQKTFDTSVVPYCREREIKIDITGLKPNTYHDIFFDNSKISGTPSVTGDAQYIDPQEEGKILSDEHGEVHVTINIEKDKYPAGKKTIRICDKTVGTGDLEVPDISKCTSSADFIYNVSGESKDAESSRFVRSMNIRKESSNSENVSNDALNRDFQRKEAKSKLSKDNIAQIFSISPNRNPKGICVKSIDLPLDSWPIDTFERNLPLKLMIKPLVNGFPSPSKVINESIIYVDDLSIPSDGSGVTASFSLPYPTYLEPGEYCIELETNSSSFGVKTYLLPSAASNTTEEESSQDNVVDNNIGELLLPKNVGSNEKIKNEVLAFSLNKCKFTTNFTNPEITISNNAPPENASELKSHVEGLFLDSNTCELTCGGKRLSLESNDSIKSSDEDKTIKISLKPIDEDVSPFLDIESTNFVSTKYIMSSNILEEEDSRNPTEIEDSISRNTNRSRYITKTVQTIEPATNVRVIFDKREPPNTQIHVYLKKIEPNSTTNFDDAPYFKLQPIQTDRTPLEQDEYRKVEYGSPVDLKEFNTFAIKIVFTASAAAKGDYPSVKNLRVIAI